MVDYGFCVKGCEICHGLGWIREDIDEIHDPQFGKVLPCPNSKFRYWDNSLNIALREAKQLDWNKYVQTDAVKQMRQHFNIVLERGYGWLYIFGEPGNGKTIMSKSAAIYSSTILNYKSLYIKFSELMNNLRSSYDEEHGQQVYQNKLEYYSKVKMLVIDEIGRDRATEFSKQSLSDIMDKRYNLAIEKTGITIWVSNFKPEEIFEPYQVDRVRDGRFDVLNIVGVSVRPAMEYQEEREEAWWQK